jgi:ubiquinone/menaquinone biosynthesis C-methylase UbiE
MRRAAGALEFLDRPVEPADRAASLADVDRLNAWFGGYALSLRGLARVAARAAPARPVAVLDVGGGAGGFAARVARWARRAGRPTRVVLVEHDPTTLALARPARAAYPEIALVRADATALPFRAGAFDVVTSGLLLHHLEPAAAVAGLREMARVARGGVIVNDLLRSRVAWALVWLATRLVARHRFSRHDGPLSVRRAYSPQELRALGEQAGLGGLTVRTYPWIGRVLAIGGRR